MDAVDGSSRWKKEVMCDADQRTPKYAAAPPRHLLRSPLTLLIGTAPLRST
jgi:hypothetical protein